MSANRVSAASAAVGRGCVTDLGETDSEAAAPLLAKHVAHALMRAAFTLL